MAPEHHLTFGPFRLEMTQGRLWRGDQVIPLRPRSLAMLGYLVAHAGRLVTKAEVLQHVWGGTHVAESVLRVSVREIRAALGDAAGAPQYLETVGGQGYRFLGGGDREEPPPRTAGPLVGRQGNLAALEGWYQQAVHGTRQLVFISGEAGVGKTTVVEMFLLYPKLFVPSSGVNFPMYGVSGNRMEQNGYPAVFNIEADTREEVNLFPTSGWVVGQYLRVIGEYQKSLEKYPNPKAINLTEFGK